MKILRPERLARSRSGLLYLRSATESSKSFGVPVPAFRTLASNSKTFSRPPDTVRYRLSRTSPSIEKMRSSERPRSRERQILDEGS